MKLIKIILLVLLSSSLYASVPTEEGLLKNLNNPPLPGNIITLKAMIKKVGEVGKEDSGRSDYYKFVIIVNNEIALFQINYSGSQMLNNQIQDVKYFPDIVSEIRKDKVTNRGAFYGLLTMLSTNLPNGMNSFLQSTGVQVVSNKHQLNEEKMKLLKTYRNYLATTKGKGEASSPLNPQDPAEKVKVIELFKASTYKRSKNVSLERDGAEFLWLADWKNVKAYFTNEERRFKALVYDQVDLNFRIEASEYTMFNNNNEMPKYLSIKDDKGDLYKVQFISEDVKKTQEKKITDRFDEAKKAMVKPIDASAIFGFLY